ncbi:MAG: hypothetical protein ACFB00_00600 [Parvularculaceae bacterium]
MVDRTAEGIDPTLTPRREAGPAFFTMAANVARVSVVVAASLAALALLIVAAPFVIAAAITFGAALGARHPAAWRAVEPDILPAPSERMRRIRDGR